MADGGGADGGVRTWRVTGRRLWLYVVLLVLFLAQAAYRLVELMTGTPLGFGDGFLLVAWLVGAVSYGALVLQLRRSRVSLTSAGIEVRTFRTRVIPYADVDRAYRNRFNRGAVTLDLVDASKVVLPAPVAALKDPAPELDEAVDLINARVRAGGDGVEGDPAG